MTLRPEKFIAAENLDSAEALLKEYGAEARVLAGGTDLMGSIKDTVHAESPRVLIGLKTLKELNYVTPEAAGLRIGALTTLREIARDPEVRRQFPMLAQAAASVASPQIRNVATLAGNLCQEPRCWYYRNPKNNFDCLRKGGAQCDALFAENRYHSIFGGMCVSAAPCKLGCPIHNNIPDYMALLREGKVEEAVAVLIQTNPLMAVTGRVCNHNCEESCNRVDYDEAVSIRSVERYLGDYALAHADKYYPAPTKELNKRVAIIGSGPAGLTAAYFLRKQGYGVTVYEQMPRAGGMLTYSIPAYRLSKEVMQSQVDALVGMGIQFVFNARVGAGELTLENLRRNFDSVLAAAGLWTGRKLKLEKSELLDSGLDFLIDIQSGKAAKPGRRVLVIGGGSVAVDVAVSAHRLGAEQVTMACLESMDIMPAMPEDIELASEEGIEILPSWGPQRVLESDGKLTGLELVSCTSVFDKDHRFSPTFDPAVTRIVECDQVLVAIGQAADLSFAGTSLQSERGLIAADKVSAATSMEGVFAAGDVSGRSVTVVSAMADGKKAALSIASTLGGTLEHEPAADGKKPLTINREALASSERVENPRIPVGARALEKEDTLTWPVEAMTDEAWRCANCGCVAVNASDLANVLVALDAEVRTTQRTLQAGELFSAAENGTTLLNPDELIREVFLPAVPAGTHQVYLKFRIRNSIDFPIVSVAYRAHIDGGQIHDARLVLGAVAPIPLRAREVEKFLEGKPASAELARDAAALSVKDVQPLARNRAKVEILKALVSKAVMGE